MNNQTKLNKAGAIMATNPFTENGADTVEHEYLKFAKTGYFAGKEKRPVEVSTKLIANMFTYEIGFVNFPSGGGKPIKRMWRVADGVAPDRNELPDNDIALWPLDDKAEPKDPFQEISEILFADPETSKVYRFSTTSNGGRKALRKLSLAYGKAMADHPDEWPIVMLELDGWNGKNGWIAEPSFPIISWINKTADGLDGMAAVAPPPKPALAAPGLSEPDVGEPPAYLDEVPPFDPEDDPSF
jgi:hypothetical protein